MPGLDNYIYISDIVVASCERTLLCVMTSIPRPDRSLLIQVGLQPTHKCIPNSEFDIVVMIDRLCRYPLRMAISQWTWKLAADFQHVRTVRLGWFFAQTFENYLPFICPRLDRARRLKVGENGQIQEAVGLGRPSKLLALSLFLTFVGGGNS